MLMVESEEHITQSLDLSFDTKEPRSIQCKLIAKSVELKGQKSSTICMPIVVISIITALMAIPLNNYRNIKDAGDFSLTLLFTVINILAHELGHIYFCLKAGRSVNGIGLKINYLFPMVFVDTTDICMANKIERVKTSLGGILLNSIIGHISLICAYMMHSDSLKMLSLVSYYFVLSNIIPFIKMDGYYVVEDVLGVTRLREKSIYSLVYFNSKKRIKHDIIYYIYGILNVLFLFSLIVFMFSMFCDSIIKY
ncbi:M50 family metallopeptidase [Butyrivibrio sp. MC2013]|uniref:M50 family metallopeptidase n=1 Tax=Butyrivibrio sp. MC2013 TaxID=1280686 RepID=UPI0018CBB609|nr:M50 family metallopeptidase [Butyrivibrio sp. MC2013]